MKGIASNLDSTLSEKDACKDRSFSIKLEINALRARKDNLTGNKEFVAERLAKVEATIEELNLTIG